MGHRLASVGPPSRSLSRSGLWASSIAHASASRNVSQHTASQTRPTSRGRIFQQRRLDTPPSTATLSALRLQRCSDAEVAKLCTFWIHVRFGLIPLGRQSSPPERRGRLLV